VTPARILQISDCHLAARAGQAFRGLDPDANLSRLGAAVARWSPDLLVLTGDLSEDASIASYERLRDWILQFGSPAAWLPGNHDDRDAMARIFDAAGFLGGPVVEAGGWQLALLDSTWPDDPAGELDDRRLTPLDRLDDSAPAGVFVHHQPMPVGAHWIDKVGMRAPERLWDRIGDQSPVRFVAFGHVHQRFRADSGGVKVLACPSTAANSLPGTERFTPGETTPLARWFVLQPDRFRTGYLAP
jgi:Icc protein